MTEDKQESTSFITGNQQVVNNSPFMIMRLDTTPLINDIKNFLSSKEVQSYQDKNGSWKNKEIQVGLPLANPEGIMRVCNLVRMRINKDVVQGNFKEDHYWDFIGRARKEICETVVKKCYDWDIDDSNLNMVIDEICALIEGYLTRPINNEERKGYSSQIQARESIIQQVPKSGGFQSFASGIGK